MMNQADSNTQTHEEASPLLKPKEGLMAFEGSQSEVAIFTRYYLETRASLRAYLTNYLRNDAACEDCMQEAILVLWEKRQPDWQLEDFRKLAFTCARFKALSWLKKNKPKQHLNLSPELAEKLAQKAAEVNSDGGQLERVQALRHCVDSLPEKQRQMVKSRYEMDGVKKLSELATSLNKKMSAIYKQLERTRHALRKCVETKLEESR